MRKALFIAILAGLFLFWPSTAHAAAGYCSVHVKAASANSNSVTTTNVDTSGCTELVVFCSGGLVAQTFADSKMNTWTALTPSANSSSKIIGYYAENPTVGASHNFTCTSTGAFPSVCMIGLNGTDTSSTLRQQSHAQTVGAALSLQPGAVSPMATDISIVALGVDADAGTVVIDSSFTITDTQAYVGGTNYGVSCGYKTTPSGTENPTWSWDNSVNAAASSAVFKASGGSAIKARRSLGPRVGTRQTQ